MLTTSPGQIAFIQLQERKRERSKVIVTGIFAYIHCGQRPLLLTRESIPDSVSNSHTHNQYRPFNFKETMPLTPFVSPDAHWLSSSTT